MVHARKIEEAKGKWDGNGEVYMVCGALADGFSLSFSLALYSSLHEQRLPSLSTRFFHGSVSSLHSFITIHSFTRAQVLLFAGHRSPRIRTQQNRTQPTNQTNHTPHPSTKMHFTLTALTLSALAALTNAHGYFVNPPPRQPGDAFTRDCGAQANSMWSSDINGNIQGLLQVAPNQPDFHAARCKVWKCKGMKWADNKANLQTYSPGQKVPMNFNIAAPHDGHANVSIIALRNDEVIATLKTWEQYALTSRPTVESEEKFSVTIPDLGGKCTKGGQCAIQMFWDAPSIDQTYESCIDFKIGGANSKRDEVERVHARDFVDEGLL